MCCICRAPLAHSCYYRNCKLYCKHDYDRIFGVKCSRCGERLLPQELVMRAAVSFLTLQLSIPYRMQHCNICNVSLRWMNSVTTRLCYNMFLQLVSAHSLTLDSILYVWITWANHKANRSVILSDPMFARIVEA